MITPREYLSRLCTHSPETSLCSGGMQEESGEFYLSKIALEYFIKRDPATPSEKAIRDKFGRPTAHPQPKNIGSKNYPALKKESIMKAREILEAFRGKTEDGVV